MLKKLSLLFVVALVVMTAGCNVGSTGQTSTDAQAVQQFFPTVTGFNTAPVNDIIQAFSTITGGASLATGNILGAAAIARLTSMIDCYRNVGAVDARVYTGIRIPPVIGAVAIINQNRAADNFLSCATGMTAQGATAEPQVCVGSGSFVSGGDTFLYLYASSDGSLCESFVTHFNQYK
ncbi:MAG: hypothetical protein H7X77_05095 [Anaerolineae bacterium]|nr:hypothetical protein [Anaerolineae bacterium]